MKVSCPMLVIAGADDRLTPPAIGIAVAEATDAELLVMEGVGHSPPGRTPVRFNLALRDFFGLGRPQRRTWHSALHASRRALFVSSPSASGMHGATSRSRGSCARSSRTCEIDWLAQEPVTRVLEAEGERIHPASAELASEAAHIDAEARGHELDVFQALPPDGRDPAGELHALPRRHRAERVRPVDRRRGVGDRPLPPREPRMQARRLRLLTDFVGFLPLAEGGAREAFLTADYNAEMLEHIERYPRSATGRSSSAPPTTSCPTVSVRVSRTSAQWTEEHFAFTGYIPGHDGARSGMDRDALRAELGYGDDERICIATAGGSAAGAPLLRRVIEAHPAAARRVPGLRTIIVAGPRIDPARCRRSPAWRSSATSTT